ncbi:hypothetical protein LA080_006715 [Diaporthe eres]|nr:hypothetical protein LA080_006715 [Diaporthe eres]
MRLLKTILGYAGFGKRDKMDEPEEFVPTDVFKHRYRNPQVLIDYVKTLPDNFTDNDIKILDRSRLGLKLPRELKQGCSQSEMFFMHLREIPEGKGLGQEAIFEYAFMPGDLA